MVICTMHCHNAINMSVLVCKRVHSSTVASVFFILEPSTCVCVCVVVWVVCGVVCGVLCVCEC